MDTNITITIRQASISELSDCQRVITESFGTVAEKFGITPCIKGLYSIFKVFYRELISVIITKICVIPEPRCKGYEQYLLDFAAKTIKGMGIGKIAAKFVNQNKYIKQWFVKNGYSESDVRDVLHLPFEVCYLKKNV